ncbi:MAG: serine hydrolase domain-containing protein [Desulfosudaceae bacterium]
MFNANVIDRNFINMDEIFEVKTVNSGDRVSAFRYDLKELPEYYTFGGEKKRTADFINHLHTTGLIVLRGDTVLYEEYFRQNSEKSKAILWSISKSVVSALFGIAVGEGHIQSIEQTVTEYLPFLKDSGYNGVRIKDVLQMSSGIDFNEDYTDFFSDINRLGRAWVLDYPLDKFVASLKAGVEPGTYNRYISTDTLVLSMIIAAATGKSLTEYTAEKLWKPAGMESDAFWLVDGAGMEATFGGLNAVLRDLARFGLIYLNNGKIQGKQIVPADWVEASVTPDAPHLMPGENPASEWVFGYGYQWWIPENPDGDFIALGICGQAVYVYPRYNIVIARTAAYPDYDNDGEDLEIESINFFRAIARGI